MKYLKLSLLIKEKAWRGAGASPVLIDIHVDSQPPTGLLFTNNFYANQQKSKNETPRSAQPQNSAQNEIQQVQPERCTRNKTLW